MTQGQRRNYTTLTDAILDLAQTLHLGDWRAHLAGVEVIVNAAGLPRGGQLEGDDALRSARLDWVILRPSLVYGDGSYGGTSLIRGMAGLPWFIPLPGSGEYAEADVVTRRRFAGGIASGIDTGRSGAQLADAQGQLAEVRGALVGGAVFANRAFGPAFKIAATPS